MTTKQAKTPIKDKLIGKQVPKIVLPATSEKKLNLEDLKGKKIVLYFYPKDSTPGCTVEGQDFSKLYSKFKKENTEVFGISRDSVKSHENFKSKMKFPFELLSDSDEKLCKVFDVIKEKNMYGRMVLGISRSTFVIDTKGEIVKSWRGVKVPGHAQEVLEYIQTL